VAAVRSVVCGGESKCSLRRGPTLFAAAPFSVRASFPPLPGWAGGPTETSHGRSNGRPPRPVRPGVRSRSSTTEHGASNAGDEGETPSASANSNAERGSRNAEQASHALSFRAPASALRVSPGRNVSSGRPRSERGGRGCESRRPDHFGWLAEQQCPGPENRVRLRPAWVQLLHHPPIPARNAECGMRKSGVRLLSAFRVPRSALPRPVAQEQSARPITGRRRSVTCRDDHSRGRAG
jgi:hypothetical protein